VITKTHVAEKVPGGKSWKYVLTSVFALSRMLLSNVCLKKITPSLCQADRSVQKAAMMLLEIGKKGSMSQKLLSNDITPSTHT